MGDKINPIECIFQMLRPENFDEEIRYGLTITDEADITQAEKTYINMSF